MCGGIVYNLEKIPRSELDKFYSPEQIKSFEKRGLVSSFFWDKRPVLPVITDGKVALFDWGNRDIKDGKFPQTGWAKEESITHHKWDWMHPKKISIPVKLGYEKGKWFEFESNINGILVEKEDEKRVYMTTQKSNDEYLSFTKHNRMPSAKIKRYITK